MNRGVGADGGRGTGAGTDGEKEGGMAVHGWVEGKKDEGAEEWMDRSGWREGCIEGRAATGKYWRLGNLY